MRRQRARFEPPPGYAGGWFRRQGARREPHAPGAGVHAKARADAVRPGQSGLDRRRRHRPRLPHALRRAAGRAPSSSCIALVARLHSSLLDRSRPLWEFTSSRAWPTAGWRSTAGASRGDRRPGRGHVGQHDLRPRPGAAQGQTAPAAPRQPLPARRRRTAQRRGAEPAPARRRDRAPAAVAGARAVAGLAREAWAARRGQARRRQQVEARAADAVQRADHQPARVRRRVAAAARGQADRQALGASINDVVLWLCSTALRSYEAESRELPAASLVAGVPISLRAEGDTRR